MAETKKSRGATTRDPRSGVLSQSHAITDPRLGTAIGKYRVLKRLGQGGMGIVYEAEDMYLKRRVAIKLLPDSVANNPADLKRFVREARLAARFNHPNAVTIHEVDQRDGTYFLVMELVRGSNAEELLKSKGALSVAEASRIVAETCRGLSAAHAAGLIHRDIKPSNIMLAADGAVKLGDFGLAKVANHPGVSLTGSGIIVGTPLYMSPEQCRSEKVDARSDIYSLGAAYFHLLTGRPPFGGDSVVAIMFAHCSAPAPDPRAHGVEVPNRCVEVLRKAMAKEPSARYQSAAELQAELESLAATPLPTSPPAVRRSPPEINQALIETGAYDSTTVRIPKAAARWWPVAVGVFVFALSLPLSVIVLPRVFGNAPQDAGPTSPDPRAHATRPEAPPHAPTRRVLFILPEKNFWMPDYDPVRRELEQARFTVDTASLGEWAAPDPKHRAPPLKTIPLREVNVDHYDAVIFGGGMGVQQLVTDLEVKRIVQGMIGADKYVTALCMGSGVLVKNDFLKGKRGTGFHPQGDLMRRAFGDHGATFVDEPVVVSGKFITGRDDRAAVEFARTLIQELQGP